MEHLERPPDMYDRQYEWDRLTRFVANSEPGATLGVVSGRRRQGKSFLLEALSEAAGGFYFAGIEESEAESLQRLGSQLGDHLGAGGPVRIDGWGDAIDRLLYLGQKSRIPVILDEFPYLCKGQAALPSILQAALGPRRKQRVESSTRLLLCGSALTFMGKLLSGPAPLRGRAGLELVVHAFDYRTAAAFWDIDDWRLAVRVHAIVGGTPAYRREFVGGDVPDGPSDFDSWVARRVLDPAAPLLREGRYLLGDEVEIRDRALFHGVLGAIANGHRTAGAISSRLGRPADTLRHAISVLEDTGFIYQEKDSFKANRSQLRIAEPLVDFYHAVVRPQWPRIERPGNAEAVWADSAERFSTAVLGPHFENLAREWTARFAGAETLGGQIASVAPGTINNPAQKRTWQVDVAALGQHDAGPTPVLAIGEAKWGERIGMKHLVRMREARNALGGRNDFDASKTRILLFSGIGFTDELRNEAKPDEIQLVDLDRLYLAD